MKSRFSCSCRSICSPRACIGKAFPSNRSVIDLLIGNVIVIGLQDITAPHAIPAVVLKGDYLDRGALDAMLAAVRARVAAREAKAH